MTAVLSRSNGETAKRLDEQLSRVNASLHKSVALGALSAVRGELADVYLECSEPNWDGFNALPVDPDSFAVAKAFLLALPLGTQRPSPGAEPDGQITLEWYGGTRRSVSISFDPKGFLHYAALIGVAKSYGSEVFDGEIPVAVLDLIRRVC